MPVCLGCGAEIADDAMDCPVCAEAMSDNPTIPAPPHVTERPETERGKELELGAAETRVPSVPRLPVVEVVEPRRRDPRREDD